VATAQSSMYSLAVHFPKPVWTTPENPLFT
jgi:hypothetical protein